MASTTRKSKQTTARILEAARRLFAERGYERTTIRDVSALAEIDPALVMRYFGNKENLFARAADFNLELPDTARIPRPRLGRVLAEHFLHIWEDGTADGNLIILLRAAASNEGAAETLRRILRQQILPAVRSVSPGDLADIRAGLIASQMLGLALTRYVLCLPPVVQLSREQAARLLAPTLQRYFVGHLNWK